MGEYLGLRKVMEENESTTLNEMNEEIAKRKLVRLKEKLTVKRD